MNKDGLSKLQNKQVRFDPIARRVGADGIELLPIDDLWLTTEASRQHLVLRNPRSDQYVTLGTDHVREYMTDIGRSDGILKLKSQIFLFAPAGYAVEPLR